MDKVAILRALLRACIWLHLVLHVRVCHTDHLPIIHLYFIPGRRFVASLQLPAHHHGALAAQLRRLRARHHGGAQDGLHEAMAVAQVQERELGRLYAHTVAPRLHFNALINM